MHVVGCTHLELVQGFGVCWRLCVCVMCPCRLCDPLQGTSGALNIMGSGHKIEEPDQAHGPGCAMHAVLLLVCASCVAVAALHDQPFRATHGVALTCAVDIACWYRCQILEQNSSKRKPL